MMLRLSAPAAVICAAVIVAMCHDWR